MFGAAQGAVQGAAAGVQAGLTSAGSRAAGQETAATAAAHLPGSATGRDLSAEGAGAGAAAGAIGQAMINALQEEQKAALTYAQQLPGFATAEGQQQTNQAVAQLAQTMATQLAQTTAQVPQLTYSIYQDLLNRAQTDRTFAEQVREFQAGQAANQQQAAESTRQFNVTTQQRAQEYQQQRQDALAANRAKIVGPNAPTTLGRVAYYQSMADQRSKYDKFGRVYTAKPDGSGVTFLRDPKGNIVIDPAFMAAQKAGALATRKTEAGITQGGQRAQAAVTQAQAAQTRAANVLAVAQAKAKLAGETINLPLSRSAKQWVNAQGQPIPGLPGKPPPVFKPTTPKPGPNAVTGVSPRIQNGHWVQANGKRITDPNQIRYWNGLYKQGYTDGKGKIRKPIPPGWKPPKVAGAGSGPPPGVTVNPAK
jgi:hypothetical protein